MNQGVKIGKVKKSDSILYAVKTPVAEARPNWDRGSEND